MNRQFSFMSTAEKDLVLNDYDLVEPNSANASQYLAEYPALTNEPIYVLK